MSDDVSDDIDINDEYEYTYKVEKDVIFLEDTLSDLPGGLKIFTLPITTSLSCNINLVNIFKYYPLNKHDIIEIKTDIEIRSLKLIKKKQNDNSVNNFFNQITLIMIIFIDDTYTTTKEVNIKLFGNNSVQVSGLLTIFQCNYAIVKLLLLLKGSFGYLVDKDASDKPISFKDGNFMFKQIRFLDEDEIYIKMLKISTINLTFKYVSKINQVQFYYKLLELKLKKKISNKVVAALQTDIVASVNIWLPFSEEETITIFVFESGIVSIMACKTREHILFAYNFIHDILLENHEYVIKKNMVEIIANNADIRQYIDMEALAAVVNII